MTEGTSNILLAWEVEAFIENFQATDLESIGTKGWFEFHKKLMLLNQQSTFEISGLREESVKEWFITFRKIPILIYEAIQISIWKKKVFPLLVELCEEPTNTFLLFSVFYHEGMSVSLLENVLYYSDSVETISDSIIDLIDYAVNYLTMLIYSNNIEKSETFDTNLEELMQKKSQIEFDIAMRCISILRYLAEFIDYLPLCAISRLLAINDVPYLFSQLIELQPWKKINDKGEIMIYNGKWEKIEPDNQDKICNFEGQVWFGLRELLLNPKCGPYYDITQIRIAQLLRLQKYLEERVLDQIAPLIELRRWLSYLNITAQTPNSQRPINVELIPEIITTIKKKYHKKWSKLAKHQAKTLLSNDIEYIKNIAQILSDAYDFDKLDIIDAKKCICKEVAKQRCSKCKEVWYCGRKCQVNDWKNHKVICESITNSKQDYNKNTE